MEVEDLKAWMSLFGDDIVFSYIESKMLKKKKIAGKFVTYNFF